MSLASWLSRSFSRSHARRGKRRSPAPRPKTARLFLEQLETRLTPSFGLSTLGLFNGANGANPQAGLIMDSSGNLYGTGSGGGANGDGTVFEVAKGSGTITTLASFNGTNGQNPSAGLVMDGSGNLFGTAINGGPYGTGTAFELAKGSSTITALASFNGPNGQNPAGGLVMDSSGNLYGTTEYGGVDYFAGDIGSTGQGTVFELARGSGTITALASFNGANGAYPNGIIMDGSGNLYGTTFAGGGGSIGSEGSVFELARGSRTITTLALFGGSNGAMPSAGLIMDSSGNFYGTTEDGGPYGAGTVFELAKGSGTITTLATFYDTNTEEPASALIRDSSGNLYGTAAFGSYGAGTVFEVAQGSGTITTLASFDAINGRVPFADQQATQAPGGGLIMDSSGNLYGTTALGGVGDDYYDYTGDGTVFELLPHAPALSWTPTHGATPPFEFSTTYGTPLSSTLLDASAADSVTGAAVAGTFVYTPPAGTIPLQVGWQTLSVTFTPTDTTDYGPITTRVALLVSPATPVLTWNTPAPITYGTSLSGTQLDATATDPNTGSAVSGTLVYTPGTGTFVGRGSTILNVTFTPTDTTDYTTASASVTLVVTPSDSVSTPASLGGTNGTYPEAGLIRDSSGNLYGTTESGGASNDGTIFELAQGSGTIDTLASFNGTDGASPYDALIMDSSGDLYGTTVWGGASNDGTVFELAQGSGTITRLASFTGANGTDPIAGLIMDGSGNLYGTAAHGGAGYGTVFELAQGSSTITLLAEFNGTNGRYPSGGRLAMDSSGNLYGTTVEGGASLYGTVFEVVHGSLRDSITALATFNYADGDAPQGGLIMDSSGNLYGTTELGGANYDGTVFKVAKGSSTITTLASFNGANGEGSRAALIMDSSGNLYGTTAFGGANYDGTVFEVGAGSGAITNMVSFGGSNGEYPDAGLLLDSSGNLYGTTEEGGTNADGTVFELPAADTQTSFHLSGFPSSTSAGTPQAFTVTAENPDGSTDTGYTGTVQFTSTDRQAALPANYTFTAANVGVATFTATLKTAGTQAITATDTANGFLTGSGTTTVTAAAASSLTIGGFPSPTTAGTAANVTVTALDAYGNIATGYTGTVHFTSSDAKAVLPANYTFTAADAGKHVFAVTLKTAGTQSLTATDTVTAGMSSTQTGITVNAAAASVLVITGPASATAGVAFSITVTAYDAYGNVATGYTGTVNFKSTDSSATLPANYTFKASDNGTHTFSGFVLKKKGKQSITATDTLTSSITGSLSVDDS